MSGQRGGAAVFRLCWCRGAAALCARDARLHGRRFASTIVGKEGERRAARNHVKGVRDQRSVSGHWSGDAAATVTNGRLARLEGAASPPPAYNQ